jgi:hypothetical protein
VLWNGITNLRWRSSRLHRNFHSYSDSGHRCGVHWNRE